CSKDTAVLELQLCRVYLARRLHCGNLETEERRLEASRSKSDLTLARFRFVLRRRFKQPSRSVSPSAPTGRARPLRESSHQAKSVKGRAAVQRGRRSAVADSHP